MSSVVTAVFKATVGLLVNKGRDVAAERLKEGDVTEQKFRGLIVREIDNIKAKLDGLARKDLSASISFFKEGIEFLYVFFGKARSRSTSAVVTGQAADGTATDAVFSLAERMRTLDLTSLDESATRALANSKDRFKDARRKATEAFCNEALELSDRVLAMQYRVMSTILETVDNPEEALAACKVCTEELHSLSAVQTCFNVGLKSKGLRAWFSKDERVEIISTVCHVNRVIYNVTQMVASSHGEVLVLPCVNTGKEKVDPLRDGWVTKVLREVGLECCCVPWSFGQEGDETHKLKSPQGITTNTHEQFLIADNGNKTVKVFDSSGNFLISFNLHTDDANTQLDIRGVFTDMENNTFVLVRLKKHGAEGYEREVWMFNETGVLQRKFPARRGKYGWRTLTVCSSKVLVMSDNVVDVYKQDGELMSTFLIGADATDIASANDGRLMVVDRAGFRVFFLTEEGKQLSSFSINIEEDNYYKIACHPTGKYVVVAGHERETSRPVVAIFTKDGEFVRRIQLDEGKVRWLGGITVTMKGHIVAAVDVNFNCKVIVV